MDLQLQPSKVTANDRTIMAGDNTDQPGPAAMAPPVVREQAPQGGRLMLSFPAPAPATQEGTARRARETEPGELEPPTKRMRTTGAYSAEQTATFPLQAETCLLAMPDDVLLLIAAAPDTPATVADVRHREWLRACCKDLQKRVAAPLPGVVQDLKYQASEKNIRAVLSDTLLDGQQVQTQVRALCDRYGDVRVSLRNRAGLLSTLPHSLQRNRNALAGIGQSREMRSLLLDLNGAQDVTVKALCEALRQTAPTRVSLTVRGMKWGNGALAALLDRDSQSDAIVSVAIDGSGGASSSSFRLMEQGGWGAKPVQSLRRMLQNNRSLELLDLSWMHPGDDALEAIAQSLAVNSTLVQLWLPGNELSEKGMQLLGEALGSNVGLATLKLDENRLGRRGAQGLLAGLRKNRTLTALSLSRCMASDATALELFSLFEHNDTLRTFEFRHAAIKGPVVACLARLLQVGRRLEVLDLPGSPIGPEGAQAIADLLASDTMLSSLDLSCCSLGDDELRLLKSGLLKNTGLRHLSLAGNKEVTSAEISKLARALELHPRITSLNFHGIRIDNIGIKALAGSLLANHPTLEQIDLSHCVTGPKVRRILAEAMQANTRLKKLVMEKREIDFESSDSE
jgi:Ran GTPase-activating protein (RanGAP) involved in mRNA processing and transport